MKYTNQPQRMGSPSVVSIAAALPEGSEIRNAIQESDYIRNETLRRCYAIPSYAFKSLRWKNRYYDTIRKKVEREVHSGSLSA